jgi:uncharacterized protein
MMILINARTGHVMASAVEVAVTSVERRRGLLGRDTLDVAAALVLSPCCAVHTAFMRFPIDVTFLDGDGEVIKIVRDLAPWRIAVAPRARAVVEFAGGSLRSRDIQSGDRIYLRGVHASVDRESLPVVPVSLRKPASNPACWGS